MPSAIPTYDLTVICPYCKKQNKWMSITSSHKIEVVRCMSEKCDAVIDLIEFADEKDKDNNPMIYINYHTE